MTERRERVRVIFAEALNRRGEERAAYLATACGGDEELHREVISLLGAIDNAGEFLAGPTLDARGLAGGGGGSASADTRRFSAAGAASLEAPTIEGPGTRIGAYKLLQPIGEGGFGAVFMAEQEHPVRRKVAVKIIKAGLDTRKVVARFEAERQALAMMDHPNIARVFDGGATATGRPYFVMELVRGIPITDYCDKERLNTEQRLDLFMAVCRAVQHAHQKGIIHRDIKPSNIMVTLADGKPIPKVIDFGIAKATHDRLTDKTLFTEFRQLIGTPEYMSPEQAEMTGIDIDTRSDIYSLGVLLYQLLTGTLPHDPRRLRSAAFGEIQRIIREEDPPKPSTRMRTLLTSSGMESAAGSTATTLDAGDLHSRTGSSPMAAVEAAEPAGVSAERIAKQRSTTASSLCRRLRGELDWVVMRCLEKDRTRRYETANDLARDIERHLSNEPVVAGPPSTAYRVRKFVQRNRGLVVSTALVMGVLLLGIVGTSWMYFLALDGQRRAQQAEEAAIRDRNDARDAARVADQEREAARLAREDADERREEAETNSYVSNLATAEAAMRGFDMDRARARLYACPERLRGWEWHYFAAIVDNSTMTIRPGHPPEMVSFSPDGRQVVVAFGSTPEDQQAYARLYDTTSGREVAALSGHSGTVWYAGYSRDGSRIVTASQDKSVRVWDAATGSCVSTLTGHNAGMWMASLDSGGRRVASADVGAVRLFDAQSGRTEWVIPLGERRVVGAVVFGPNDETVIASVNDPNAPEDERQEGTYILRAADGVQLAEVKGATGVREIAAFSGRGERFVTRRAHGITVYQTSTAAAVLEMSFAEEVCAAAISPDGARVAIGFTDGSIQLAVRGETKPRTVRTGTRVSALAYSPDGSRVAASWSDGRAAILDAESGATRSPLMGHTLAPRWIQFNTAGTHVATAAGDGTVRIWGARPASQCLALRGHTGGVLAAGFTGDAGRVFTYSWDDQTCRFWDAATGEQLGVFRAPASIETLSCAAMSRDGGLIAMGGKNGQIAITDVRTGNVRSAFAAHTSQIVGLHFSADSRRLMTIAAETGTARVWDVATQALVAELPSDAESLSACRFSEDGGRVVAAAGSVGIVWSMDGAVVRRLEGHTAPIYAAAFSHDGWRIVTGSQDGTAGIWDWDDSKGVVRQRVLLGHGSEVRAVSFSPDDARVLTASGDGTVRVWDARSGLELMMIRGIESALLLAGDMSFSGERTPGAVWDAAFSPDGTRIVTAGGDKVAVIYDSRPASQRLGLDALAAEQRAASRAPDVLAYVERAVAECARRRGVAEVCGVDFVAAAEMIRRDSSVGEARRVALLDALMLRASEHREKSHAAARARVDELRKLLVLPGDMRAAIEADDSLSADAREESLLMVSRLNVSMDNLNTRAWRMVCFAGKEQSDYEAGLRIARAVVTGTEEGVQSGALTMRNLAYHTNTLGVALYRVGRHEEALELLHRSEKCFADAELPPQRANWIFIALCEHRLGRREAAQTAIERARSLASTANQVDPLVEFTKWCEEADADFPGMKDVPAAASQPSGNN